MNRWNSSAATRHVQESNPLPNRSYTAIYRAFHGVLQVTFDILDEQILDRPETDADTHAPQCRLRGRLFPDDNGIDGPYLRLIAGQTEAQLPYDLLPQVLIEFEVARLDVNLHGF